jgi:hypothetical protein
MVGVRVTKFTYFSAYRLAVAPFKEIGGKNALKFNYSGLTSGIEEFFCSISFGSQINPLSRPFEDMRPLVMTGLFAN